MTARWLRNLVPASGRNLLRRTFGWRWMRGDYPDWESARRAADALGGSAPAARVITAARAVREGRAAWDRDGVLFAEPQVHAPLLAALREIARAEGGRLRLVDFGGGLGSSWWQHREALADLRSIDWRIVELPRLVAAGRQEFTVPPLSFHASLGEAFAAGMPDVVLFSSVLQYVPVPQELLRTVAQAGVPHLVLDRVSLHTRGADRLVVQHTPPRLGGGASPCWLFSRATLLGPLEAEYALEDEWADDFDQVGGATEYRGFRFRRRPGRATAGGCAR